MSCKGCQPECCAAYCLHVTSSGCFVPYSSGCQHCIGYFHHCLEKVPDHSNLLKGFLGSWFEPTVIPPWRESWQQVLEAAPHIPFSQAAERKCAQLLSTVYSVWYSSSWNGSAQRGSCHISYLTLDNATWTYRHPDAFPIGDSRFHQGDKNSYLSQSHQAIN